MPTLDDIRTRFSADKYATEVTGVKIISAAPDAAVCSLTLAPHHMNANGIPQGGAIFTLADFCFAVAANAFAENITVSLHHDITFLSSSKGNTLFAKAMCVKRGKSTVFFDVSITDNLNNHIAHMTVNGFTLKK